MCFIHDFDWYAEINEQSSFPAERKTTCYECYCTIQIGEQVHHIYLQQYEEPYNEEPYENEDTEADYGEVYEYDRCHNCHLFLECVKEAEIEAGCSPSESLPPLEDMINEIQNRGEKEAQKYFDKCRGKHHEMKDYLDKLWERMFDGKC